MKTILLSLFSVVALVASAFADEKSLEDFYRLPQDAVDALNTGTKFELYSIEPGPLSLKPKHLKPEEDFYGFKMLGHVALTDPKKRSIAVGVVMDAIHHSDFHRMAMCFFPRHALQVTANGRIFDFVICYQCGQIKLYEKGAVVAAIGIPESPQGSAALNKLLSDAGIPLAEWPMKEDNK